MKYLAFKELPFSKLAIENKQLSLSLITSAPVPFLVDLVVIYLPD